MALVTFSELLEDAFLDPTRVDYALLRELYVASASYVPYGRDDSQVEALHHLLHAESFDAAIEIVESLLESDPLAISLRLAYAHALDGIGDDWEASTQRAVANGLIKAIMSSGDGRTEQSAIVVLDERERQLVLELLGVRATSSQRIATEDGWFDCVTCTEGRTVFLDVSWPQGWLMAMNAN